MTPSRISPRLYPAPRRSARPLLPCHRRAQCRPGQGSHRRPQGVIAKYPSAKDALRELGFSYFQQHDYAASRDIYEKLQTIDPDDLAAHYQLAILYRRLGEKEKAAIESAKFADQKDDPTASTYALEFLGKHPEVAAESVVWHTHDLTGDPVKRPEKIDYKYIPGAGL